MKLLLHNMLASNVKGITTRFPLAIVNVRKVEVLENEFDEELAVGSLARIEYDALRAAAVQLGYSELPEALPEDAASNTDFLQKLYHALMNIDVIEGELVCPESGRVFPILNGIPNMLLREDEV